MYVAVFVSKVLNFKEQKNIKMLNVMMGKRADV